MTGSADDRRVTPLPLGTSSLESARIYASSAGGRLGPCEVIAPLGVGGMGEVYRARYEAQTRLALKILPDSFTNDPDRLARFRRETEVLRRSTTRTSLRCTV